MEIVKTRGERQQVRRTLEFGGKWTTRQAAQLGEHRLRPPWLGTVCLSSYALLAAPPGLRAPGRFKVRAGISDWVLPHFRWHHVQVNPS